MNKTFLIPALALGLAGVAPAAQAAPTISFDTTSEQCVTDGSRCMMLQSYGDTTAVDVSYENIRPDGTVLRAAQQFYANFGDLGKVLTAGNYLDGTLGQVTLRARDGYRISLLDFDFAGYVSFARTLPLKVLDLMGNELIAGTYDTGNGSNHSNLAVNSAFLDGIVIRWGPDASVGGLDNIRYEVQASVPEPASWAMMIAGLGLAGGAMRTRRRQSVALAAR